MHCAYGPKQGALKYTAHVEAEVQSATSTVDGETKVHMHHTFKTVQHEKR